jgi:hypothetical protein
MRSLFERVRCSAWRSASSSSFSVAFAWSTCIVRLCCESSCVRNLRRSSSVRSNSLHGMIASMKTWSVSHASLIFALSVTVCDRPVKCCSRLVQNRMSQASDHELRLSLDNPASTHFSSASRLWKTRCAELAITCVLLRKTTRWRVSFPCRKCSTRRRHRKGKTTKYWVFRACDDYL